MFGKLPKKYVICYCICDIKGLILKRANLLHLTRVSLGVTRMESYFFHRLIMRAKPRYSVTDSSVLNSGEEQVAGKNELPNVKS